MDKKTARGYLIGAGELLMQAREFRQSIKFENICKYGVEILDRFLGGILPAELVVVGADTGLGKSEIAYNMALQNALNGKKVLLFALEGDIYEIAYRFFQKEIAKKHDIRSIEYRFNIDPKHDEYEKEIIDTLDKKIIENLKIFDKSQIPTLETVKDIILALQDEFDMFVIDHLHYIYMDKDTENVQIGAIMRVLKSITDIIKKPVVLMSHLRKRDKRTRKGEEQDPETDDLHGSSNIGKEATTVVLLTRMNKFYFTEWSAYEDDPMTSATKFIVTKSRAGLPLAKFGAIFNMNKKDYVSGSALIIPEESIATDKDALSDNPPANAKPGTTGNKGGGTKVAGGSKAEKGKE